MTKIIASGDFEFDAVKVAWFRSLAPDIESVQCAETTSEMCEIVTDSESPVVTIVRSTHSARSIESISDSFVAGDSRGGLVAVGSAASADDVTRAFKSGARGWVLNGSPVEELITAVRAVACGHLFVPSALPWALAHALMMLSSNCEADGSGTDLTCRELDVLRLLAVGDPNSEIASNLYISEATVHSHVLNILRKLKARNRTEAVAMVYQRGIVRPARAAAV